MQVTGKRIKRTRLIRGGRFVVEVEVEMVIPPNGQKGVRAKKGSPITAAMSRPGFSDFS
jgi:hypothetical protein